MNNSPKLKRTGEQRQFGGTGNIENQDFDFGEQGKMSIFFQGNKGKGTPSLQEASLVLGIGQNFIVDHWLCKTKSSINPYPAVHDNPYLCKQRRFRSDGF